MSSITSSQFAFPSFPKTRSFGQLLTIYNYTKFLCCSRSSSATNLMLQLLRLAILVDDLFSLIPKISGYEQWIRLRAFHHSTTHPWSNPIIRHRLRQQRRIPDMQREREREKTSKARHEKKNHPEIFGFSRTNWGDVRKSGLKRNHNNKQRNYNTNTHTHTKDIKSKRTVSSN